MFCSVFSLLQADQKEEALQEVVMLRSGQVHDGDYFAMGNSVEISGTVLGDAYIMASQAIIDGKITGDLLVLGGSVEIAGEIEGSVRVLAGQVTLSGHVERNVTIIAASTQLSQPGEVDGNAVLVSGNIDLAARMDSNVTLLASNLRLASTIQKNVWAYVGQMRITSKARISGDVNYRSSSTAWIDPQSKIGGSLIYRPSFLHGLFEWSWLKGVVIGSKIAGLLMNFLYTFVIGWILIRMFRRRLDNTLHALQTQPLKSFVFGIVLLILFPLASLILLMTVLGAPFALTLIALNIISFYSAKVFSILWASNWLFSKIGMKPNRMPLLASGQVLYYALTIIPVFGTLLAVVSMLFGLGGAVVGQQRRGLFHHG